MEGGIQNAGLAMRASSSAPDGVRKLNYFLDSANDGGAGGKIETIV